MLVTRVRLLLATVSFLALGLPVEAGDRGVVFAPAATGSLAPPAETPAPARPERAAGEEAEVDESALRYYASQNATSRVEAEIRRLRTLHPGWEPPTDLYRPSKGSDEQPLWDLYAADRLDDLRAEVERRQAREPGWKPTAELETKIRTKDARRRLIAASDKAEHATVVEIARAEPGLVAEDDPDAVWRVAAAHAAGGDTARALELYDLVLAAPTTADLRLATVRKALAALGPEGVAPLLAKGRRGADGRDEFEPVKDDLVRARIGTVLAGAPEAKARAEDAKRLRELAAAPGAAAGDLELLGWLARREGDPRGAVAAFEAARARGGGDKASLGLVLALRDVGRAAEAEKLAYEKRLADDEFATQFLEIAAADLLADPPPATTAERLIRIAEETGRLEAAPAAEALAWYAWKTRQPASARAWFEKALAWRPTAKSAEGHLLALLATGERVRFAELFPDYRTRWPDLAAFTLPSAAPKATGGGRGTGAGGGAAFAAHKRGDHRGCLALLDRKPRLSGEEMLLKGWCLIELDRPREAALAFEAAQGALGAARREDAAYGQSLAHLRDGRTTDASRAAASEPLSPARQREIAAVVLAQHAIAAFDGGDYRSTLAALDDRTRLEAEPRDLMTMRGWALYHLGRNREARRVFALLDQQMSTKETRAGLAAADARLSPQAFRY